MTRVTDKTIIGFSDSVSLLYCGDGTDRYFSLLKSQSPKARPVIYFIGAANGDDENRVKQFDLICERHECESRVFNLYDMAGDNPRHYFTDADIIYIDGGVTRNLMALFKEWNVILALKQAYEKGVVLSGASAGINAMFEWCITDSIKSDLRPLRCLGILKGTVCAHFDIAPDRQTTFEKVIKDKIVTFPAYGLDETVCVIFRNGEIVNTESLRETACLHKFDKTSNKWRPISRIP